VGAVLARDGMVLSTGYNGAPRGLEHCTHDPGATERCRVSVHAEMNALIQAAYHGHTTKGATLYVTHEPCIGCSGPIINAGIIEVRFANYYHAAVNRGSNEVINRLAQAGISMRKT